MRRRGHYDETGRLDDGVNSDYADKYGLPEDSRVFGGTSPEQVTVRPTQPTPLEQAAAPQVPSYGEQTFPTYTKPPEQAAPTGYQPTGYGATAPTGYGAATPTGYGAPAPSATAASSTAKFFATGEKPMVFALRSDPTLFVYEFADRLEFYRNTHGGMLLCNVEYKRR